jgi:hypothetical protein
MGDTQALTLKLDRASELMFARDIDVVDALWSDGFRLVGSEEGEMAATRDDLEALVSYLFAAPFRLRWVWDDKSFTIENDIAWVFAQGHLEFVYDTHTERPPYRLVAIFRRDGADWKWRLYSGSEPVPARPFSRAYQR